MRSRSPFTIDAFVLLPDHLHCIWTLPAGDADYSSRWNRIKRETSIAVRDFISAQTSDSMTGRAEIGLWQRRFWEHTIRDEADFSQHIDYIHWNPVKHGLVEQIAHWPYSSFHRYVHEGRLPANWAGTEINGSFGET